MMAAAVLDQFRAQAPGELDSLRIALAQGDAASTQRIAHGLKSMIAHIGDDGATELAQQIEHLGAKKQLSEIEPLLVALRASVQRAIIAIAVNKSA